MNSKMSKKVVVVGTFDTKALEYKFIIDLLRNVAKCQIIAINTGVMDSTDLFQVDIESDEVARAGGSDLTTLRAGNDRGNGIATMSDGIERIIKDLYQKEKFNG